MTSRIPLHRTVARSSRLSILTLLLFSGYFSSLKADIWKLDFSGTQAAILDGSSNAVGIRFDDVVSEDGVNDVDAIVRFESKSGNSGMKWIIGTGTAPNADGYSLFAPNGDYDPNGSHTNLDLDNGSDLRLEFTQAEIDMDVSVLFSISFVDSSNGDAPVEVETELRTTDLDYRPYIVGNGEDGFWEHLTMPDASVISLSDSDTQHTVVSDFENVQTTGPTVFANQNDPDQPVAFIHPALSKIFIEYGSLAAPAGHPGEQTKSRKVILNGDLSFAPGTPWNPIVVPEPSSLIFVALFVVAFGFFCRRR